jgi:hypothetical protein
MPIAMKTICQYIAEDRKKDTIYIVFNSNYNNALLKRKHFGDIFEIVDKTKTDNKTREEFLEFMKTNLPDVKLVPVGDYVSLSLLEWPYLGTIAIDVNIDSKEFEIITQKYGNPYKDNFINDTTLLWIMPYEEAMKIWEQRKESWENF